MRKMALQPRSRTHQAYVDGRINDYAKDGGPGEIGLLCSFCQEPLRTLNKINVRKFAV